jgi:A1 cistron-splicing factor AAR2
MTANTTEEPSTSATDIAVPNPSSFTLHKSDSNASASAQSFKSHASIPVTGAYPYGTLRVHQASDPPRISHSSSLSREILMKPLPDDPPPLEAEDPDGIGAGAGDVVLILDLPPNFTVGYDSVSFTTRNFRGVRDIPPGAHFFWASETEASTTRTGFWVLSTAGTPQVHIVQWDKFNEVLGEPASQAEARIQRENIRALYPVLTPYQYRASNANPIGSSRAKSPSPEPVFAKNTNIWQQLTCCVSETMLSRVTGRGQGSWAVQTTDRVKGALVLPAELELDKRVPNVVAVTELNFTFSQAAKTFNLESVGAARTEQANDATGYIISLLDASGVSEDDVVGELQFAFIAGMHLGNESCVQQWWHMLLRLILRAQNLTLQRPRLSRLLLQTITAQLVYNDRYLDGSILDYGPSSLSSSVSAKDDLRLALIVYKRRLNELLLALHTRATEPQVAVGKAFSELEAWVWKLGWDIRGDYLRSGRVVLEDGESVEVDMDELLGEDERGEYAAVVVDLDEEGRQKDLVSWS